MIGIDQSTKNVMGMLMLSFLFGCSGSAPASLGVSDGRLAPCPDKPNCVASDARDDDAHHIDPFRITDQAAQAAAWSALKKAVGELPRTTVIKSDETYLHAEARSRIFRFVDDLEFQLRPEENLIALRSAARTGRRDFGVNTERLEELRQRLQAEGVLR